MRTILLFFLLFFGWGLHAQSTSLFVNDNVDRSVWQQQFNINDQATHALIRPYHRPNFASDSTKAFWGHSWPSGCISPIVAMGAEASYRDELTLGSQVLGGLSWNQDIGKRVQLDAAVYGGMVDGTPAYLTHPASADVYPGIGEYRSLHGRTGTLGDVNFSLRFEASEIFTLEVGKAKQFIGEGYRSLFLSDNASPYPYFKINTKVWHINYTNLFSWQQGKHDLTSANPQFEDKFTSSHLFSWNVSPRTNVHLFETIIWQGKDTLSDRGFDVYYLNPIIFYRPVEFAAGSADNAIIGLGLDYKVYPSSTFYANLVIDEFLLEQVLDRQGWWGNKIGAQVGVKSFDMMKVEGLYGQAEINVVRPFTFSHGSPVQNYAHLDEALAHPLGANFFEALLVCVYEKQGWEVRDHLSMSLFGRDGPGENLGGNIFQSYVNPDRNLGNSVGQGIRTQAFQNSIYLSRIFHKASDSRMSLAYHFRYDAGVADEMDHVLAISFRSNFGDGYR